MMQTERITWIRPCGKVGPYALPHRTAKGQTFYILECNRPAGHDRDFHCHSLDRTGPVAKWSMEGVPIWPHVIEKVS